MDQDLLKTSTKQRVIIAVIAILMLGSMIASYAAIVMGKGNNTTSTSDDPLIAKYEEPYNAALRKISSTPLTTKLMQMPVLTLVIFSRVPVANLPKVILTISLSTLVIVQTKPSSILPITQPPNQPHLLTFSTHHKV